MSALPTLGKPQPLSALPTNLAELVSGEQLVQGHFSQNPNNALAFLYSGSRLDVVNVASNEVVCSHDFVKDADINNDSIADNVANITCCLEIVGSNKHLVSVGFDSGLLCLLELSRSLVVLRIRLPKAITSMTLIAADRQQANQRILAEQLMFMDGVLALGTKNGHVYLLDLALDMLEDDEDEQLEQAVHDVKVILPHDVVVSSGHNDSNNTTGCSMADVREQEMRSGRKHLCMILNNKLLIRGSIEHLSSENGDSCFFPERRVSVTCLSFMPQLASLVVAFNYGGWQLWNTNRLMMEYSSTYTSPSQTSLLNDDFQLLPVVKVTFIEPADDPKSLCYLCVLHSEPWLSTRSDLTTNVDSTSGIHLFSLFYRNRMEDEQFGVLFTTLANCELRLSHKLTQGVQYQENTVGKPTVKSLGLNMFSVEQRRGFMSSMFNNNSTVNNKSTTFGMGEETNRTVGGGFVNADGVNKSDMALVFLLWQVFAEESTSDNNIGQYYFGLFDINAWYQAQIPNEVYLTDSTQCSFFSVCPLDDVMTVLRENSTNEGQRLMDVNIKDVTPFSTMTQAEPHFYPSSVAFEMSCLSEGGIVRVHNLGLQGKVLSELESNGHLDLCEPRNLFELCSIAGLLQSSNILDESEEGIQATSETVEIQRRKLLNVALVNNRAQLLINCVTHWNDGKLSSTGCTRGFLLDWAWNQVVMLKQAIDKYTLPLFDYSSSVVDEARMKLLFNIKQRLGHLCSMLEVALQEGNNVSNSRSGAHLYRKALNEDLHDKLEAARKIKLYVTAIVWFANSELLPELPEEDYMNEEVAPSRLFYPLAAMRAMYGPKRARNRAQASNFSYLGEATLMIDHLCNALGPELRERYEASEGLKANEPLYPPPSLHALLASYLVDSTNDMDKHNIVHYFFLDLASLLAKEENMATTTALDQLIKFPSAFGVSPSSIKLTQAFWLLDHEDFDEAFYMLLDPLIVKTEVTLTQRRAILMAFLTQGAEHLALKYSTLRPPQDDIIEVQLHLAILLANGMALEAFEFQRRHITPFNASQMLPLFFMNVQHLGKLDILLQTSFNAVEEEQLFTFLQSLDNKGGEVMLTYLLRRSRFKEAWHLYHSLNQSHPDTNETRKQLMMDFYKSKGIPFPTKSFLYRDHLKSSNDYKNILSIELQAKFKNIANTPVARSVEVTNNNAGTARLNLQKESDCVDTTQEGECRKVSSFPVFTPFRPRAKRRKLRVEIEEVEVNSLDTQKSSKDINDSKENIYRTPVDVEKQHPSARKQTNETIAALLRTPIIVKKKANKDDNDVTLPTSIMKSCGQGVKRSLNKIDDEDEGNDEETWLLNLNPSKSLRFDFPEEEDSNSIPHSKSSEKRSKRLMATATRRSTFKRRSSVKPKRQSMAHSLTYQMLQRRSELFQVKDKQQELSKEGATASSATPEEGKYVMTDDEDSDENTDANRTERRLEFTKASITEQGEVGKKLELEDVEECQQRPLSDDHPALPKKAPQDDKESHEQVGHPEQRAEPQEYVRNEIDEDDTVQLRDESEPESRDKLLLQQEKQHDEHQDREGKQFGPESSDPTVKRPLEEEGDCKSQTTSSSGTTRTYNVKTSGRSTASSSSRRSSTRRSTIMKASKKSRKSIAHSLLATVLELQSIPDPSEVGEEGQESGAAETDEKEKPIENPERGNPGIENKLTNEEKVDEKRSEAKKDQLDSEAVMDQSAGDEDKDSVKVMSKCEQSKTSSNNDVKESISRRGNVLEYDVEGDKVGGESSIKSTSNVESESIKDFQMSSDYLSTPFETPTQDEGNIEADATEKDEDQIDETVTLPEVEMKESETSASNITTTSCSGKPVGETSGRSTHAGHSSVGLSFPVSSEPLRGPSALAVQGENLAVVYPEEKTETHSNDLSLTKASASNITVASVSLEGETPRRSTRTRHSSVRLSSPVPMTEAKKARKKSVSLSASKATARSKKSSSSNMLTHESVATDVEVTKGRSSRKKSLSATNRTKLATVEETGASPSFKSSETSTDFGSSKDEDDKKASSESKLSSTATEGGVAKGSKKSSATIGTETTKPADNDASYNLVASTVAITDGDDDSNGEHEKSSKLDIKSSTPTSTRGKVMRKNSTSSKMLSPVPETSSEQDVRATGSRKKSTSSKSVSKTVSSISKGSRKKSASSSSTSRQESGKAVEVDASPELRSGVSITDFKEEKSGDKAKGEETAVVVDTSLSTPSSVRRSARLMHNESRELGSLTWTDDTIGLNRSARCRSESPTRLATGVEESRKRKKSSSVTNVDVTRKRRTARLSTVKEIDDGYQPFSPHIEEDNEGEDNLEKRSNRRSSMARRSVYKPPASKKGLKKFQM